MSENGSKSFSNQFKRAKSWVFPLSSVEEIDEFGKMPPKKVILNTRNETSF